MTSKKAPPYPSTPYEPLPPRKFDKQWIRTLDVEVGHAVRFEDLPPGTDLFYVEPNDEYDYRVECYKDVPLPEKTVEKDQKRYEKELKVYEAEMKEYVIAKARYDAFHADYQRQHDLQALAELKEKYPDAT